MKKKKTQSFKRKNHDDWITLAFKYIFVHMLKMAFFFFKKSRILIVIILITIKLQYKYIKQCKKILLLTLGDLLIDFAVNKNPGKWLGTSILLKYQTYKRNKGCVMYIYYN